MLSVFLNDEPQYVFGTVYHYPADKVKDSLVSYESQKKQRTFDIALKDPNTQIVIFRRKNAQSDYEYVGDVVEKRVVQERKGKKECLIMGFSIEKRANVPTIQKPKTTGYGKSKIPVLNAFGFQLVKGNLNHGIIEVRKK